MITRENFKDVLRKIGFSEPDNNGRCIKKYGTAKIAVDFREEKLEYPQGLIARDKTTSNFSHNENFVVFECVCRLLEKGYRAEHIELEPKWKFGRGQKGGKADILVKCTPEDYYGNAGVPPEDTDPMKDLIIIECKTTGPRTDKEDDEFLKEERNMWVNGGQLFSYWQFAAEAKWLVLYSSDWESEDIVTKYHVIKTTDDANVLEKAKVDKSILIYSTLNLTPVKRFRVWKDTYDRKWYDKLIFGPESKAYEILASPLRKKDLKEFKTDYGSDDNKLVNNFEEILRHNNVSDKENAFNRLLALFICKLVDEIKKDDDKEVDFQYRKGADTYEDFQDRLQELHHKGMKEFMKEETTYVDATNYAKTLFKKYKGEDRDNAIEELNETIRMLKFYSNNDFAFKEVHNKELFNQNSKILVEVVRLFERYKIVCTGGDPKQQQFLGDLFEKLLNKGFKQNEGQFFTPTPITRFIWDALPLEKYYQREGLPKVVDYACGAGHFLTEAIKAINAVAQKSDNTWVRDKIFGIEKDYRLARVSKVSMFMHGAGDANIIFGDGLENYPDKQIKENSFDILVANPPYAVKEFKQHLDLNNNTFELLKFNKIEATGNEIETLFVERIAQLLKPRGMAAVILPVALLNKNKKSYIAAREQLLKNFYFRAVVSLGNKTFNATGTNTIILFLERYNEPPCHSELVKDCCNKIMNGKDDLSFWSDKEVFSAYLDLQNIADEEFQRFVSREMEIQEVKEHPYFKIYTDKFKPTTKKRPSKATQEEYEQILKDEFYKFALKREEEKIYYFALAYEQRTLVITAPTKNKEQTKFLGYKWCNRRRKEGIQISPEGGKLCDKRGSAPGTLADAIRRSFAGEDPLLAMDKDLQKYSKTYSLNDMLDFSKCEFSKEIGLYVRKINHILKSKYPTLKLSEVRSPLGNITRISADKILSKGEGDTPVVTQGKDKLISGYINTDNPVTDLPLILFGDHNCVLKYIDFKFAMGPNGTLIKINKAKVDPRFAYFYLSSLSVENEGRWESHIKYIENISVPIPPPEIQKEIVLKCEAVEKKFRETRMESETYRQKIVGVFKRFGIKWIEEEA